MSERKQATILYTSRVTVPGVLEAADELLPGVRVVNI
jgi:hypothetical protein